mgnify:CR=1 FL=1
MTEAARSMDGALRGTVREGKYLTFTLAGEEYGAAFAAIDEVVNLYPRGGGVRHRDFEDQGDHWHDAHHHGAPDAPLCEGSAQPAGQGYTGDRPAASLRRGGC